LFETYEEAEECDDAEARALAAEKQVEELQTENAALRDVGMHGCKCSMDEACEYVRQRDVALAKIARVRDAVKRKIDAFKNAGLHTPGNRVHDHMESILAILDKKD